MVFTLNSPYIKDLSIGNNLFEFSQHVELKINLSVNLGAESIFLNFDVFQTFQVDDFLGRNHYIKPNLLSRPIWVHQVNERNLVEKLSEAVNFFIVDSKMSDIFKNEF